MIAALRASAPAARPQPVACSRPQPQAPNPDQVDISPGVTDMRGQVITVPFTADQAASLSVDQAVQAAAMGTFGVGGLLLGPHREVIAMAHNQVVKDGAVNDPTAHGERQLVDWYFKQVRHGDQLLPPAGECTIVTSLDPCMMCTGALLTAGFKVETTALDPQAGVNYPADSKFIALPEELRTQAQGHFGYFGVDGLRGYAGPDPSQPSIRPETEKRSLDAFLGSLETVRNKIHQGAPFAGYAPEATARLRQLNPQALSFQTNPQRPGAELAKVLLEKARASQAAGNSFDATVLLDPEGKLLLSVGGEESQSPTRTPFMELTRTWTSLRKELSLPELKNCKLVTLQGPGRATTNVMELGAYGSSVEGALPEGSSRHWQYVIPRQDPQDLKRMVDELPPLYSQVIHPDLEQVEDPALIQACQQ